VQEYASFLQNHALPGDLKVTGLALAGLSVGASITGVSACTASAA